MLGRFFTVKALIRTAFFALSLAAIEIAHARSVSKADLATAGIADATPAWQGNSHGVPQGGD